MPSFFTLRSDNRMPRKVCHLVAGMGCMLPGGLCKSAYCGARKGRKCKLRLPLKQSPSFESQAAVLRVRVET